MCLILNEKSHKILFRIYVLAGDEKLHHRLHKNIQTSLALLVACPRGNGVMDSMLACGAGEPGLIPALSKWFFLGV